MFKCHSNGESVTAGKVIMKIRTRFKTCTLLPLKQHCKGDPAVRKKSKKRFTVSNEQYPNSLLFQYVII